MVIKTWCVEFERECEGKDVIHVYQTEKPTEQEAIRCIKDAGYHFSDGYDAVRAIWDVT